MVLIFILIYFEWRDTENQQLVRRYKQYYVGMSHSLLTEASASSKMGLE